MATTTDTGTSTELTSQEKHSRLFLDQIRDLTHTQTLPFDVTIVCKGNEEVRAHKFVLHFASGFFKAFYHSGSTWSDQQKDVKLNLQEFKAEDVSLLFDWIYTGFAPSEQILEKKVFDILTLANFLLVDIVNETCFKFIDKMLSERLETSPKFLMDVYKLGDMLNLETIINNVEKHFLRIRFLPKGFLKVRPSTMLNFLVHFDKCNLAAAKSVNSLDAKSREQFILDLVILYIKRDKPKRLKYALEFFTHLKLILVLDDLDMDKLGVEELKDRNSYRALNDLLDRCRSIKSDENLFHCEEVCQHFWTPRPGSIKYNIWSQSKGRFKQKVKENAAKEKDANANEVKAVKAEPVAAAKIKVEPAIKVEGEQHDINQAIQNMKQEPVDVTEHPQKPVCSAAPSPRFRRFLFERKEKIKQIDVYTNRWSDGKTIIDGIRFIWSNDTIDEAGSFDGTKNSVVIPIYEGVTVTVDSDIFLNAIKFQMVDPNCAPTNPPVSFGPFGRRNANLKEVLPNWQCGNASRTFENRIFLDGLRGYEVRHSGRKAICGLKFKMSFFANTSLEEFFKSKKKKSCPNSPPASEEEKSKFISVDFLTQENHKIFVQDMREVANACQPRNRFGQQHNLFRSFRPSEN